MAENLSCEMIRVDGGTFNREGNDITVSSFEIGKYQVTQALYESVMGKNPSRFSGKNNPVESVSWYDAVEFCNALSKKDGLEHSYSGNGKSIKCDFSKNGYRLPTEAEWEFAARGGKKSQDYTYSGSDNIDEVAWYEDNANGRPHKCGTKKPNELGIYDMSGNVWEWCNDWYGNYGHGSQTDPHGASSGSFRVSRGGSWYNDDVSCYVSVRNLFDSVYRCYDFGFRLVRSGSEK